MARLPKAIIQKYGITKKAWSVFRGQKRSRNSFRRVKRTMPKKGRYSRFRARFRRSRGKSKAIPILPLIGGFVAPMMDSASRSGLVNLSTGQVDFSASRFQGMVDQICQHYTGFAPFPEMGGGSGFHWDLVAQTYGGLVMGILGHKLASKFGVNRSIKKIPLIGDYISL